MERRTIGAGILAAGALAAGKARMGARINRRGFVAGAAALAGLRTRADWLKFFDRDEVEPEDFHVLRRPFGTDPSREISLLGCGGVRLCVERNNQNKIDRELATKIFDYCYRHGVN